MSIDTITIAGTALPLDEALAAYERLQTSLRDAAWPRMTVTVRPVEDGEDGETEHVVICPRCGNAYASEEEAVLMSDIDERDTSFFWQPGAGTPKDPHAIAGSYDTESNWETFLLRCVETRLPVRLPLDVAVHES